MQKIKSSSQLYNKMIISGKFNKRLQKESRTLIKISTIKDLGGEKLRRFIQRVKKIKVIIIISLLTDL